MTQINEVAPAIAIFKEKPPKASQVLLRKLKFVVVTNSSRTMKYLLVLILCLVAAECGRWMKCKKNSKFVAQKCDPEKTGKKLIKEGRLERFSYHDKLGRILFYTLYWN